VSSRTSQARCPGPKVPDIRLRQQSIVRYKDFSYGKQSLEVSCFYSRPFLLGGGRRQQKPPVREAIINLKVVIEPPGSITTFTRSIKRFYTLARSRTYRSGPLHGRCFIASWSGAAFAVLGLKTENPRLSPRTQLPICNTRSML